jgi:hypothetical protein
MESMQLTAEENVSQRARDRTPRCAASIEVHDISIAFRERAGRYPERDQSFAFASSDARCQRSRKTGFDPLLTSA